MYYRIIECYGLEGDLEDQLVPTYSLQELWSGTQPVEGTMTRAEHQESENKYRFKAMDGCDTLETAQSPILFPHSFKP